MTFNFFSNFSSVCFHVSRCQMIYGSNSYSRPKSWIRQNQPEAGLPGQDARNHTLWGGWYRCVPYTGECQSTPTLKNQIKIKEKERETSNTRPEARWWMNNVIPRKFRVKTVFRAIFFPCGFRFSEQKKLGTKGNLTWRVVEACGLERIFMNINTKAATKIPFMI